MQQEKNKQKQKYTNRQNKCERKNAANTKTRKIVRETLQIQPTTEVHQAIRGRQQSW